MDSVSSSWDAVDKQRSLKKEKAYADLKLEQEKETLRMEYARLAKEFSEWIALAIESCGSREFGDTLEAVMHLQDELLASSTRISDSLKEKRSAIAANVEKQEALHVSDNVHSNVSATDLEDMERRVLDALQERKGRYEKELARQEAMEAKRKEFAAAAQKVKEFLESQRAAVDSLNGKQK